MQLKLTCLCSHETSLKYKFFLFSRSIKRILGWLEHIKAIEKVIERKKKVEEKLSDKLEEVKVFMNRTVNSTITNTGISGGHFQSLLRIFRTLLPEINSICIFCNGREKAGFACAATLVPTFARL